MDPLRSRKGRTKLTIEIPDGLLKRARKAARDEQRALWVVVMRALEMYLSAGKEAG